MLKKITGLDTPSQNEFTKLEKEKSIVFCIVICFLVMNKNFACKYRKMLKIATLVSDQSISL